MLPRTCVGIEIAGQDLRIAVIRQFAGKRRLLRTDAIAGFSGMSDDNRKRTLSAYFRQKKIPSSKIYLTLPSTSGLVRDLEFPIEAATRLRSAVTLQVENLSPWTMDEIYWDFASEPVKKGMKVVVAHVAIIPRAALDPWIALFRFAGCALMGASLSSLSWAHGASTLWVASSQPTMILFAEHTYVEGALLKNGRLYAAACGSGDSETWLPSAASQLLRTGRVDSTENVRVIVHGGANPDAGAEPIRLPIEAATANATQTFGAIATALLGTNHSGFRANLIPVAQRQHKNHMQWAPTYALGILLIGLGVTFLAREPYQQRAYAERLDQEVRRIAPEVRSVADQEKQLNGLSDRLKTLDAVVRGRDANLEALRELARVLPPTTWMNAYQNQDGVVTVSGFSQSAAALQKLLEDSPVFRDVQFTSSITRDPSGKDKFTLRATLEAAR